MDITPDTPVHDTRPGWESLYRALPKTREYEKFRCRDCGTEVLWARSKKGFTYLAQEATWSVGADNSHDGGTHGKSWFPKHDCEPVAAWQAQYRSAMAAMEAQNAAQVEAGAIVRGQTVEVVKGRKVPIGTTGVVFWVAAEADAYDAIKVGFRTADGEKHFINIKNVAAVAS